MLSLLAAAADTSLSLASRGSPALTGYSAQMSESRLGSWLLATLACRVVVGLLAAVPSVAAPAALDSSFGQMGEVSLQTQAACRPACPGFVGSNAQALALAPDGKLLGGGAPRTCSGERKSHAPRHEHRRHKPRSRR
jgi:hypothetical protein